MLIGLGGGLFSVGTLTSAMALARDGRSGIALGAWGAVQATAVGLAVVTGGALRDVVSALASSDLLGPAMSQPFTAYGVVYHLEIGLLFAALVAIGPLPATRPPLRLSRIPPNGSASPICPPDPGSQRSLTWKTVPSSSAISMSPNSA
jgi:BCD family chlorophyll transporter-like MFS transporter